MKHLVRQADAALINEGYHMLMLTATYWFTLVFGFGLSYVVAVAQWPSTQAYRNAVIQVLFG